jgi:hypothetical protein
MQLVAMKRVKLDAKAERELHMLTMLSNLSDVPRLRCWPGVFFVLVYVRLTARSGPTPPPWHTYFALRYPCISAMPALALFLVFVLTHTLMVEFTRNGCMFFVRPSSLSKGLLLELVVVLCCRQLRLAARQLRLAARQRTRDLDGVPMV